MITRKNFWMLLGAGLTILCTSTVNAQWADRGTLTQMITGVGGSRVAMSPAGSTASRTATVKVATPNTKALVGSWLETITFPPESGRPPFKSLVSFHDDETLAGAVRPKAAVQRTH